MKKFYVVMMCASCKWKVSNELNKHGYKDFTIDLNTNILEFKNDVNPLGVIRIISIIGYKIEAVEN